MKGIRISTKTLFISFAVMSVIVLVISTARAEVTVTEEWVARYDGPKHVGEYASAIATDEAGNIYVTGRSPAWGTGNDYATIAYDSSGNQLWVARYNGPGNGNDWARAIAIDSAGNIYVTGRSTGSGTSFDYATVAYDSSGNQLWAARYNGPKNGIDEATAIAVDNAGNVYVTGRSLGSGFDYATVAYDSSGNQLWAARYNGLVNGYDEATAIVTDDTGNVYVTGYSHSGRTPYDYDYATVAYDSSGNQLWMELYDGPANSPYYYSVDDKPTAIATDNAGNVYVTGYSHSGRSYYDYDYATVAYDSSGNELWVAFYGGIKYYEDKANAIAVDNSGNVYVTGLSKSGKTTYPTYLHMDYATVAYDSSGNQLWVARYDGGYDDEAKDIAIDSAGNVYVTGVSRDKMTMRDYATVAYDSSGNELWAIRFDDPKRSSSDIATALATDNSGNVYVTGVSNGSGTSSDYVTIKYSQQGLNKPPVADAGDDQTVECAGLSGTAVVLDGVGSSDPDSDTLTYTWSGPFGTADGVTATVTLPLGTHTITLTVNDGNGETATDDVVISVQDTTPPVVSDASLSGTELLSGHYLSDVLFEMSATDICSGVANVRYILDGSQNIISGSYASATISTGGDHTIVYDAVDHAGNVSAADSLSFTLFEANPVGLTELIDYFLAQGLIAPQMETSLKQQASSGAYGAFINHVGAQSGKKIDTTAAQALIQAASYIMGN